MKILLPDLQPGIDYALQLRATSGEGVSEWSPRFVVSIGSDTVAPETPDWAVLNPWVVDGDTFVATWQEIDFDVEINQDFSHYRLTLSDGVKTISIKSQNTVYVLTYEQNRNFFGTAKATITASISSVDKIGNASVPSSVLSATNPAPSSVGSVTLTPMIDSIKVDWPASTEADVVKYVVQYALDNIGGSYSTIYQGTNNSFTMGTTQWSNDHYIRVAAVDKFGSASTYVTSGPARPNSSISGDTTPPDNATAFNATATALNTSGGKYEANVTLGWTASASTDVSHYEIRYGYDTSTWRYVQAPADNTAIRIDGLQIGTPVYFGIRAVDKSSNKSAWLNATTYPYTTATDVSSPATPVAPTVATDNLQLRVEISAPPANVVRYKAYAGATSGFTANDASLVGAFEAGTIGVFYYPSTSSADVYVKVIAVSRSGALSASSPASVAVTVPRINDAMIDSLAANKITAGTGIINNLTVKSILTLGDGTTPGTIQSNQYVATSGASGYQLTDSGLIIKTGEIEAAALNISASENTIRPEYAGFEWSNYADRLAVTNGLIAAKQTAGGADGLGYVSAAWPTASANPQLFLSPTATTYNQVFEAGVKYIVSVYLRVPGAVATHLFGKIKWSDTTTSTVFTADPTTGSSAWQRFYGVVTAAQNAGIIYFESSTWTATAGFQVDLIQIEKAYGNTVPSQWRAPSTTIIDGGMIKTGAIQSTALAVDAAGNDLTTPAWVIDPEGDASLGNVNVRGSLIVGNSGESLDESWAGKSVIKSYGYVENVTGWAIRGDGYAEFRNLAADSIDGSSIIANSITTAQIQAETITGDLLSSNVVLSGKITVGQLDLEGYPINDSAIDPIEQLADTPTMDINVIPDADVEYGKWKFQKHTTYSQGPFITTFKSQASDPNTPLAEYPDGFPAIKIPTNGTGSGTTASHPTQYGATKLRVLAGTTYRIRVGLAATGTREGASVAYNHTAYMRYRYASEPVNVYGYVNNGTGVSYSFGDNTQVYWWDFVVTPTADEDLILNFYMYPTSNSSWALSSTHTYAMNIIAPQVTTAGGGAVSPVTGTSSPPVADTKPAEWGYGANTTSAATVTDVDITGLAFSWPYTNKADQAIDGMQFTYTHASTADNQIALVYVRIPRPPTNNNWAFTFNYVLDLGANTSGASASTYPPLIYWYDASNTQVVGATGSAYTDVKFAQIPSSMTGKRGVFGSSYDGFTNELTDTEAATVAYGIMAIKIPLGAKAIGATTVFKILGLEAFYTPKDNNNYGKIDGAYIDINNQTGIGVYGPDGIPNIVLPIDGSTAIYRGDAEVGSLTVNGALTVNASSMTFGKSSDVLLQAGTASPSASLTIAQQYDQWVLNRPTYTSSNAYADTHVFNPANVTSMVWSPTDGAFWVSELHNGAVHVWRVSTAGAVSYKTTWYRGSGGLKWSQPALFWTSQAGARANITGRWGNELRIEHFDSSGQQFSNYTNATIGGNAWFRNSSQIAAAMDTTTNPSDYRLVMFQNNGSSMRAVRYQLQYSQSAVGTHYTYYDTPSGSGGSGGLAGASANNADWGAFRWVAANRTSEKVKVLTAHTGSTMQTSSRWDVAAAPVSLCWDGANYWQIDSAGNLTKYSDWKWTTSDSLYFSATFYDSDATGGTHETTMGSIASQTAKQRIGKIVVTAPRVPDAGGTDDPDKIRIYGVKRSGTPTRTQLWLQSTGGSSLNSSQFTFVANSLATSGTNPPATNNFPSADSAEVFSAASDGSGALISLKGDGSARIGEFSSTSAGAGVFLRPRYGIQGNASNITVTTGTWTKVTTWAIDSGVPGYGGMSLNSAAGGFFVTRAGLYLITMTLSFSGGATGRIGAAVDTNSNASAVYANKHHGIVSSPTAAAGTIAFSQLVWANASDYIRAWAYQDSGGDRTLSGAAASQSMKAVLVSN